MNEDKRPRVIITALTKSERGEPITTTRTYAELLLCNTRLVAHQLGQLPSQTKHVTLLTTKETRNLATILGKKVGGVTLTYLDAEEHDTVDKALAEASSILPGDLLPQEQLPTTKTLTLITNDYDDVEESEETGAARALLTMHGLDNLPSITIPTLRINYPWEFLTANQWLAERTITKKVRGKNVVIEANVTITGAVHIGDNSVIKSGSYLEGPLVIGTNCIVGPHAHLRPYTSLADDVRIGKTEVVDSIILEKTTSKHHAYLGHSVLGANVNVGAFSVTADYRHDAGEHTTLHKGAKVETKRTKVGAFIGDECRLAIGTLFYPGRKLWPGCTTLPGEVVKEDKHHL